MLDALSSSVHAVYPSRRPTGAKLALKPLHVWGMRIRLQVAGKCRDLALFDLALGSTHVMLEGEYVKNIGWDREDVLAKTGVDIDERTEGYHVGVTVGRPSLEALWDWRAGVIYRYLQRDAVLDALTDSDFHLGGTDAKGYQALFDLGLSRGTWVRLRYLTANEIDGAPLGIDVWQLDLNAQF